VTTADPFGSTARPAAGADAAPVVRPARLEDLPRVVELAVAGMGWSPIMDLGPGFVSLIYRHAITTRVGFCLVAELDGRVAGFVLGSHDSKRWFRDFALRQGPRAALALLPKLFFPRHLAAIWRGATYFPKAHPEDPASEILGIVVDETQKGRRIGHALVQGASEHYRAKGLLRVKVGDIDVRNAASNALFSRYAEFQRSEPSYGDNAVNVYYWDLR